MQAIITSFTPTEDHRAAITATCMGKSLRTPYNSELGLDDNHHEAAFKMAHTLGWLQYDWLTGRLPNGDYCHVAAVEGHTFTTRPAPGTSSPKHEWRGRGGGSLPAPRRGVAR